MSSLKAKLFSAKDAHCSQKTEPSEEKSGHSGEQSRQGLGRSSHEMRELLGLFREFLGQGSVGAGARSMGGQSELEPRDREVEIALPVERGNQLRLQSLQSFVTALTREVWSRGFHYYSTDQFSLEHAKTYCSEQILRNLGRLAGRFHLGGDHFAAINSHCQKVLEYMLSKYPMTLSQDVNRSVNSAIREIDNTDQLSNDYVYTSPVVFRFRESADYTDLIMRMLNDVLRKLDLKVGGRTVSEKFQDKMERLFENVMDLEWMRELDESDRAGEGVGVGVRKRAQSREELELQQELKKMKMQELEKYRSKVQQYTSFKIGRKVPESTRPFSEEEIASRSLRIDNPYVLRLLTKWCEELERKFTTPNYFAHYIETLKLDDGKYVAEVADEIKECLDQLMAEEHRTIRQELLELAHNNHCLQADLLLRELNRPGRPELERLECIAARYSADLVHNLHAYIVGYLNRLIHGLLTVALKFGKSRSVKANQWSSNLNLVTFQVMDLLRCRCASGEREVLRLYHEIVKMSEGESVRMVRVINRLRRGTHDLLINIKYRDVLCEVQLAVTSSNNKFIEYSNTFNHYLYELRRSFFGPLTQLCSIWKSLDPRFTYYDRTRPPAPPPPAAAHPCQSERDFESFYRPFICNGCGEHLFHNNYIRHHLKCRRCNYWLCAKCQIEAMDAKALLAAAFKNEELIRNCHRTPPAHPTPQFGVCVFIESQELKVEPFRRHTDKDRTRLIGVKNRRLYEIADISSPEEEISFRRRFLVFEVGQAFGRRHIKIEDERVREFCIEETLREVFEQNKERICLNYSSLTNDHLARLSLLGSLAQKATIKKVEVIGNKLDSAAKLAAEFGNLRYLQLSKNQVTDFAGLGKLQKLQKLFVNENKLKEVPLAVVGLWNLKELSLAWNEIKSLPQELAKLHRLKILKLGNNKIEHFDACLTQLFYLTELSIKNNLLTAIPEGIKSLNELSSLQLQNNLINQIHSNIGCLQSLERLNLSGNQLSSLPDAFQGLTSLTYLNICHNRLQRLPASLSTLITLERLDLSNNQLSSLPSFARLHRLSDLNLNYNVLAELPQLPEAGNLRVLALSHNGLRQVPSLAALPTLEELYLNNNSIDGVHESIAKMERLQVLRLEHNNLSKIPELRIENLKSLNISQNKLTSFCNMDLICLEELDLSGNFIAAFAYNLLPSLKRINLANNKLEAVEVANFLKLRYVHLSYNLLKVIPRFSQRNHIKVLSLEHNAIEAISPAISGLHSLTLLNLAHNSIAILPRDLQTIESLKEKGLDLAHNPIQKVECWDFLMRKGTKSTIEALEKTLAISETPQLHKMSSSRNSSESPSAILRQSA